MLITQITYPECETAFVKGGFPVPHCVPFQAGKPSSDTVKSFFS